MYHTHVSYTKFCKVWCGIGGGGVIIDDNGECECCVCRICIVSPTLPEKITSNFVAPVKNNICTRFLWRELPCKLKVCTEWNGLQMCAKVCECGGGVVALRSGSVT